MERAVKQEMPMREPLDAEMDAMLKESFLSDDEVLGLGLQLVKMEDDADDFHHGQLQHHHFGQDMNDDGFRLLDDADANANMDIELAPFLDLGPCGNEERRIGQKNKRQIETPAPTMMPTLAADTFAPLPPLREADDAFDGQSTRSNSSSGDEVSSMASSTASVKRMTATSTTPPQAPRAALTCDLNALSSPSARQNEFMRVVSQPPLEVRTRTKNENRTFGCEVQVLRVPDVANATASVELCYATDTSVVISTMGGTLTRPVTNGRVAFDDLSVSVASPKHAEKEFVLKVTLAGAPDMPVFSTPFYAYSHKSVLKRRREVSLRAASHKAVSSRGGESMHVVGLPFVRSDRLQVVFRVHKSYCCEGCIDDVAAASGSAEVTSAGDSDDANWMSVRATDLEFFSESVLFFRTPTVFRNAMQDVPCSLQVTNDGRNFSASLPVVFTADGAPSPKRHCAIRSRM
ncbi:Hypothetical Protein FCC1311_107712 [Hondaea fermentalgiana]|uniref:Uncharacterized protein n=1 Tax=Hondaea fermentalgiana TaxID=2315210 RepID=A0A2R5GUK1_9STRA|nr:Hypothetical Protein FCC1311_107712 [Hondaea fermentalgiana]|eukprot:GBG34547.1 Hypothetical Protein FCC1311_107712 [Hondaea fermentalgiana]